MESTQQRTQPNPSEQKERGGALNLYLNLNLNEYVVHVLSHLGAEVCPRAALLENRHTFVAKLRQYPAGLSRYQLMSVKLFLVLFASAVSPVLGIYLRHLSRFQLYLL